MDGGTDRRAGKGLNIVLQKVWIMARVDKEERKGDDEDREDKHLEYKGKSLEADEADEVHYDRILSNIGFGRFHLGKFQAGSID